MNCLPITIIVLKLISHTNFAFKMDNAATISLSYWSWYIKSFNRLRLIASPCKFIQMIVILCGFVYLTSFLKRCTNLNQSYTLSIWAEILYVFNKSSALVQEGGTNVITTYVSKIRRLETVHLTWRVLSVFRCLRMYLNVLNYGCGG